MLGNEIGSLKGKIDLKNIIYKIKRKASKIF